MKYQSLEAFRGIAAIMVVLYHSNFYSQIPNSPLVSHSYMFVDFFFVLSGFVMTLAYHDKIGRSVSFRSFFLLRFGRIYPLHLFTLLLWLAYVLVKWVLYKNGLGYANPLESNTPLSFISNLLLLQSLGLHSSLTWNYPAWSVSVEFYTYFLFFLFCFFIPTRKKFTFALIIIVSAFGALFFLIGLDASIKDATYNFGMLRCVGGFFSGVIVFNLTRKITFQIANVSIATTLEVISVGIMLYLISQSNNNMASLLLSNMSFVIVIYVFCIQEIGIVSTILKTKLPQLVGRLSYSIYMIHALILAVSSNIFEFFITNEGAIYQGSRKIFIINGAIYINLILIALIIILSQQTYHHIEVPWRNYFRKLGNK